MNKYIFLLSAFLVAGCQSTAQHRDNRAERRDNYEGRKSEEVLRLWGAPHRTAPLSNGESVWTYEHKNAEGGVSCTSTLIVKAGFITNYSYRGGFC
jgi:hypothetical protein